MVNSPPDPIPISAIEHHVYCQRQCALIHVDGVWTDNVHTVHGALGHRRVDTDRSRTERGRIVLRGVPLWSEFYGLTGRADAVEIDTAGQAMPVEYKMGVRHGDTAHLQLCAQALCLEEMTQQAIPFGALWFSGPRRRVAVRIDQPLRSQTLTVIAEIRDIFARKALPAAANDARCTQCQLSGHCLPDTVAAPVRVARYLRQVLECGC